MITDELEKNQIVLVLMSDVNYHEKSIELMKALSGKNTCYITLNKTAFSLDENFKKHGINMDNVVFIDAISKTIKKTPDQEEKVYYVSSPGALTELALVVSKFLKHNFNYLVFDSINNLMTYREKKVVEKFISSLINKIKESKTKALFYAIKTKENEDLVKKCGMFVDKVVRSVK